MARSLIRALEKLLFYLEALRQAGKELRILLKHFKSDHLGASESRGAVGVCKTCETILVFKHGKKGGPPYLLN